MTGRAQLRHPRTAPISDLDPDHAVPGPDRYRDRLARNTRAAMPHAIAKKLAHQQDSHIPARVTRAERTSHEGAGDTRPLRPPGKRRALPDRCPSHQATALPGRPTPGNPPSRRTDTRACTLDSAAHVKPEHAASAAVRGRP
jgi:hypothetical protein